MLTASEMRGDSHTPPDDWDYSKGAWVCSRHGCGVQFATRAAFVAARSAFLVAKADKSREGKDRAAAQAKMHAALHPTDQGEFQPPCTYLNMADTILDPLHCLLLNLPKVIWKYTFGDRMTNEQRELVAEYT